MRWESIRGFPGVGVVRRYVREASPASEFAFATALQSLRTAQTNAEGELTTARTLIEPARVLFAKQLHGVIGFGIWFWRDNPVQVASLFELELLRETQQEPAAVPVDTTWTPSTRVLSTTEMPANATQLELWRLGPGGAPELLLIGARDEVALTVPADITFLPGQTYQLWLQGRNGRGSSAAGPKQTWTA